MDLSHRTMHGGPWSAKPGSARDSVRGHLQSYSIRHARCRGEPQKAVCGPREADSGEITSTFRKRMTRSGRKVDRRLPASRVARCRLFTTDVPIIANEEERSDSRSGEKGSFGVNSPPNKGGFYFFLLCEREDQVIMGE